MKVYSLIFAILSFLVIDYFWLTSNVDFYNETVKAIQNEPIQLNYQGAIISYLAIIFGFILFVVPNLDKSNKLFSAIKYGGGFGLISYAIFNGTNIAIFKKYSSKVALVDSIWGGTLYTLASLVYLYFT
jgi:uncharacterized membrane protein